MEWEGFIILKHRIFLFCFGGGVCSQNYTRPLPTLLLRWLLSVSGEYFFQDVVYKAKNHTLIVLVYVRGKKLGRKPIRGNRRNNLLAANVFFRARELQNRFELQLVVFSRGYAKHGPS